MSSERWCIFTKEERVTRWCLDATRIAVNVLAPGPSQTVIISLDNWNHNITVNNQAVWTSGILDPGVSHFLQVINQNPAGQYIALEYINVTRHGTSTNILDPSSAVFELSTASQPDTSSKAPFDSDSSEPTEPRRPIHSTCIHQCDESRDIYKHIDSILSGFRAISCRPTRYQQ